MFCFLFRWSGDALAVYPMIHAPEGVGACRARETRLLRPELLRANIESSMEADDDPGLLRQIGCPTFLIAGDCDFIVSPSELASLCEMIPDCSALVLPGVGHLPYWEATAEFAQATQAFIASHELEV